MFKRIITSALVFGTAALAPPSFAQSLQCLPRDALVQKLETGFGEQLVGGGLQSAQQLLEVWSSKETGSFTVFVTRPSGISCVVATGWHWNSVSAPPEAGMAG